MIVYQRTGAAVAMQAGRADDLVFDIPALIEFVTGSLTLEPGDVISTGTPAGVGVFHRPPVYLEPGDVAIVEVEGIGRIESPIADADGRVRRHRADTDRDLRRRRCG